MDTQFGTKSPVTSEMADMASIWGDDQFNFAQPEWCLALLEPPVSFYRQFVPLTGSVSSALFLSTLVDTLVSTQGLPPSHVQWDHNDIQARSGMSEKEQRTARKCLLELRLITERKHGIPPRVLIKVQEREILARIKALHTKTERTAQAGTAFSNSALAC
jgi:hypothetical protein